MYAGTQIVNGYIGYITFLKKQNSSAPVNFVSHFKVRLVLT